MAAIRVGVDGLEKESKRLFALAPRVHDIVIKQCIIYASIVKQMCLVKKSNFVVSLIGCGQIGQGLLKLLLKSGICDTKQILVSSRQTAEIESRFPGIHAVRDNEAVAKRGRIVFFLFRYPHAPIVAKDLRGTIRKNAVVVSALAGVPVAKICQMFGTSAEQTIRTYVSPALVEQRIEHRLLEGRHKDPAHMEEAENEGAVAQLFGTKGEAGVRDLRRVATSVAQKLGIAEAERIVWSILFGEDFVERTIDTEVDPIQTSDAYRSFLTRVPLNFS